MITLEATCRCGEEIFAITGSSEEKPNIVKMMKEAFGEKGWIIVNGEFECPECLISIEGTQ